MALDVGEVETVILTLAKGVAVVFPATAPVVGILTGALSALDAAGVIPHETTAVNIEQLRAQTAGVAAAEAQAATTAAERLRRICPECAAAFAVLMAGDRRG